jgi:hypothetical protein
LILQDQANEFEPAERDLMIHTADDLQQVSIAFARRSDALSSPALLGRGRRMRAVGRDGS